MKKHIKKLTTVVLSMVLLCCNIIMIIAEEQAGEILANNEIAQVLDNYFYVRENTFYAGNNKERTIRAVYDALPIEGEVLAVETARNEGMAAYIDACDIEVVNATTSYFVNGCESVTVCQNSEYISASRYSVYEWTWIEYTADGKTVESMGMGTEHKITVSFDGEDYIITADEYDESDISGICTVEESSVEGIVEISLEDSSQYSDVELLSFYNSQRELDVNAFIEYADEWVYHSPSSTGTSYPTYYNPAYYYYSGNDCVNYASQCLHAAGMAFDTSGTAVWYADVTSNTTPVAGTSANSTNTWRSISYFEPYWVSDQGYEEIAFNINSLTPGCVVINNSKNHVMVCVGYNSAGSPILNGHTNDRYHMIASGFTGAAYIIQFTYESPNSYTTLTSSATQKSGNISSTGSSNYYKFVPASTGFYDIYADSSIDTKGSIYKEDIVTMSGSSYGVMSKISEDDDGNDGNDFWMMPYLTAGETYYIEVSAGSTGSYVLHIE